jgi:hypothetical protein
MWYLSPFLHDGLTSLDLVVIAVGRRYLDIKLHPIKTECSSWQTPWSAGHSWLLLWILAWLVGQRCIIVSRHRTSVGEYLPQYSCVEFLEGEGGSRRDREVENDDVLRLPTSYFDDVLWSPDLIMHQPPQTAPLRPRSSELYSKVGLEAASEIYKLQ